MKQSDRGPGPDVSVVVVNHRSCALTLRALSDCAAAAGSLVLEELVVDSGSGPDELAALRAGRPGAHVLDLGGNRGFAAGNNLGLAEATGRHLLLLNPDAFAHGDAVATLVAHLDAEPAAGVAAPALVFEDGRPQDNAYARFPGLLSLFVDCCAPLARLARGTRADPHNVPRHLLQAGPRPIAHATGAVLLVRREAVEQAGPLDEGFFLYLEETEWQRRIGRAGWRIDAVPAARFTHLAGGSSAGGSPLASDAFLDSVGRFYPRPRAAWGAMVAGALLSLAVLEPARRLGLGGEPVREHAAAMRLLVRRAWPRLRPGRS